MPIESGQTLLHYRIVDKIGEGGMGVVWRAQDTSLGRDVAIKVLPAAWAADPERLQRFEREARLLASLNHPSIATVHGLHESASDEGSQRFIAMEFVPGRDLAARLKLGPLGIEQTLQVAIRVAKGLEAAHSAGVIHRDLKPANIRLTEDGKVKVLDFGLAKADGSVASSDPDLSPTLTSARTQAGVILGTAAYMSPEQAKGEPVDKRTDVWAFGVVLFELLTGHVAFGGDSVADTMASVLKLEPDFDKLPAETPAALRRVLRRCLQKNPEQRLHDIADARIELEEIDLDALSDSAASAHGAVVRTPRSRFFRLVAAVAFGLVIGALLWSLVGTQPYSSVASANPLRRSLLPGPEGKPLMWSNSLALSPDGSTVAVAAGLDTPSIYIRRLDSDEMERIPGTEGALALFFSPDGNELGFINEGGVKSVSLRGSARDVTSLCHAQAAYRGTWGSDGWIYFTYGESRLARVPETGGDVEDLSKAGDVFHVQALPEGRGVLLTVHDADRQSTRKDTARIMVLSGDDLTVKPLINGGYNAQYLATGHLVFIRNGGLFAVRFNLDRLEVASPAVSVQPEVWSDSIWGFSQYATALDGTLVYVSDGDIARTIPTWIDLASGAEEPLAMPAGLYNTFDLSPDDSKLAIQDLSGAQDQIYVYDMDRESFTRLTLEGASFYPTWSHDGREVFFASNRDGGWSLFRQPVDGSAPASRLLSDSQEEMFESQVFWPTSSTPDGRFLFIYTWGHPERGGDLWKVPLDGSSDPKVFLATKANEIIPDVSPDGRYVAYLSDRMGPYQIMVRAIDAAQAREWNASAGPGVDARWTPSGDALLFWRSLTLMRVPVTTGSDFTSGVPRAERDIDYHDAAGPSIAVAADGKRIITQKPVAVRLREDTSITLVTGWADEVSRLVDAR